MKIKVKFLFKQPTKHLTYSLMPSFTTALFSLGVSVKVAFLLVLSWLQVLPMPFLLFFEVSCITVLNCVPVSVCPCSLQNLSMEEGGHVFRLPYLEFWLININKLMLAGAFNVLRSLSWPRLLLSFTVRRAWPIAIWLHIRRLEQSCNQPAAWSWAQLSAAEPSQDHPDPSQIHCWAGKVSL